MSIYVIKSIWHIWAFSGAPAFSWFNPEVFKSNQLCATKWTALINPIKYYKSGKSPLWPSNFKTCCIPVGWQIQSSHPFILHEEKRGPESDVSVCSSLTSSVSLCSSRSYSRSHHLTENVLYTFSNTDQTWYVLLSCVMCWTTTENQWWFWTRRFISTNTPTHMNTHISICKGGLERSWTPPTHSGCVFYMCFGFMKWLLSDFFFFFFLRNALHWQSDQRSVLAFISFHSMNILFHHRQWKLQPPGHFHKSDVAASERTICWSGKKMCLFYMLAHTNNLLERTRVHSRSIWKPLQSRGLMRAETTLGESYQLEVPLSQREAAVMEGSRADSEVTRRVQLLMDFMHPHCSTHWIYKLTCKER